MPINRGVSWDTYKAAVEGIAFRDARIAELERIIRYWIPDEAMVPPEHRAAWEEHVKSLGRSL